MISINNPYEVILLDHLMSRKDLVSAKNLAQQLLKSTPNNPEVLSRLGLIEADCNNLSLAEDLLLRSLEIKPNQVVAIFSLGRMSMDQGKFAQALFFFERAIALNKNHFQSNHLAGEMLSALNRFQEAEFYFKRCIEIDSKAFLGYLCLASCYKSQKKFSEAILNFEKAKKINPSIEGIDGNILSMKAYLSDWTDSEELRKKVIETARERKFAVDPFHFLSFCDDPELIHSYISTLEKKRYPISEKLALNQNKKIKVGYFSADFYNHATMHLMADVFKHHDRDKFEIYAFSFTPAVEDEWKELVKTYFDEFIDISLMTDLEAVEQARTKRIDIAIDLKGHTQFARTKIFALRAAPIQVNYLGYPGTMGSAFMDYIIGDDIVIPKHNKKYFTEKVANISMCYQPNMAEREVSEIEFQRKDFGLPEDAFIYCSFNNNYKVSEHMFDCWVDILKHTKNSVLWMLVADKKAQINLSKEAEKRGLDSERLIFTVHAPIKEHLKRITLADLVLDTFPYNGHTTSSDAVRMNLPIVTLMGSAFQSRVAASILNEINMPELITTNLDDYKALAIDLGNNQEHYKALKQKFIVEKEKSALFKPAIFTQKLEQCYSEIIEIEKKKLHEKFA